MPQHIRSPYASVTRLVLPLCLALLTVAPVVQAQSPAIALWRDAESNVDIRIAADPGGTLTGRIAAIRDSIDSTGQPPTDSKNPDVRLRARPILGLPMLSGMRTAARNEWDGGTIYDARSGKTYKASMRLTHPDTLRVRGYVQLGFVKVGRTAVWVRVVAPEGTP